jgi:ABC-type transporter Mla subunit MlaD
MAYLLRTPSHLIQTTSPLRRFPTCGQMTAMVDKGGKAGPRTGTERIRKLAQAALNADVTVEQVDTILEGLSETLVDLNQSTGNLDATLERFNDTINQINELAPRLIAVVDRMEGIVSRVERIVGVGESVMGPLAATDQAVRGAVNKVRKATGL